MPQRRLASIGRKLTTLNTLVSGVVLFLACLVFGAYDRATTKATVERNLSIQAQIAGANSVSALVFDDPHTAEATLEALRAAPNIVSADIREPDGRLLAGYRRDSASPPPTLLQIGSLQAETYRIDADQIGLVRRIVFQGKEVGRVAIRSDVREFAARRAQYFSLGAIVMVTASITALLISWISQRTISAPIVDLARTAKRITVEKDYSVRATPTARTREIDVLVESFNEMLTEIQERDRSLSEAREQLEERVGLRTAELHDANRELEAFTYSVSHDLRAPLRHVAGFAGLLEEHARAVLDEQGRSYLQTIVDASTKMGHLIDDLLSFSRTGRCPLSKRTLSLNELVREAHQEVTIGTNGRAIAWQMHDLPEVHGDPALLRQVLLNLLSNAVKYTSPRKDAQIEVGTDGDGPQEVVVFVRDNGVGFDPRYSDKLFGVFQRLHSSDDFEGTGIGLANVRRIVTRHGGRVWAIGEVDHGATFYFSLPVLEPA